MTRPTTVKEQCSSCGGTGLYTGMAEKDGAAVLCKRCQGSGAYILEYIPFTGKKAPPSSITWVYAQNPSATLLTPETPGGVSRNEWLENPDSALQEGREVRTAACPKWWYDLSSMSDKAPDWEACKFTGPYADCPFFASKDRCWEQWDADQASKTERS